MNGTKASPSLGRFNTQPLRGTLKQFGRHTLAIFQKPIPNPVRRLLEPSSGSTASRPVSCNGSSRFVHRTSKAYLGDRVIRKASLSALVLLLVSVQALAATCDVRCSMTEAADSASRESAMTDCAAMAAPSPRSHTANATMAAGSGCDDHVCQSVWAVVQTPPTHAFGASFTSLAGPRYDSAPHRIATFSRFRTDRSPTPPLIFDPLISSLRV